MDEKTIEVLEAELLALKTENLKKEVAAEKAKADAANKLIEEAKEKELREEIRTELMEEMGGESKITNGSDEKQEMLPLKVEKEKQFLTALNKSVNKEKATTWNGRANNYQVTGDTYETYIKKLVDGDWAEVL